MRFLRIQLATAEQRANELTLKCQQLERQISEAFNSTQPAQNTHSAVLTPGRSSVAQTSAETSSHSEPLSGNPDHQFASRILRPTFTLRRNSRGINCSAMSSAWELWGDDTDIREFETNGTDLNHDAYLNLAHEFFARRWPYLPVLHKQTFFNEHMTAFLTNSGTGTLSNFVVNIVCAIASAEKASQQNGEKDHRVFFRDAVKDLHLVMSSENFECVQCLLLLCMYGHNEPQSVNMWYTTGLALNLAIGLDLHRKESVYGQDTKSAELYKRVFWCAYVMNCSMAINMGRPLGIQGSDISMPLPLQLTDTQLEESIHTPIVEETLIPQVNDTSTFIHIIKLRRMNADVYATFHSIGSGSTEASELDRSRSEYFVKLNQWLITAPRYMQTLSTFQSTEWFQIAFHHAVLALYRPSRAIPMPSPENLGICTESAIGLISSYSALYARNRIKYTFVAIHSLFMAAVTMLYSLRAFAPLRRELTKPVIQTNIFTFLTLFRGICNGRAVGEKCCGIVERLGHSILSLFENEDQAESRIDSEFQTWFGLQTHTFPSDESESTLGFHAQNPSPQFPDVQVDLPWTDLFTQGIDMGTADVWSVLF
ncbi:fungal-specific transcription factor domain-containing protein [Penicillium cosmopolitanum]|uniref:Fungal-specific transcription factor domain-containing protein n=1 Tax=Penicillium cosmopolitanum TaxID=1131564 RepID=A0A9W9SIZ3_9EURO|nr:fungal-specific transcription factor domain-containing protein [Penicillium cosmopolitanum]KAJ5379295.1 fungal-specific transcription factor domain-containing protein [Penicillium cosmopolitanum]